MKTSSPAATDSITAWHHNWRRLLGAAVLRAAALLALGAALVGGSAWLGGSESGLRWLCATLAGASAGRLQIDGAGGRLFGDWHVRSLRWRDATQAVDVEALAVRWSPAALLTGQLVFARVDAGSVGLAQVAQAAPTPLPDSLQLPLALRVDALHIGRLYGQQSAAGAPPATDASSATLLAESIVATLDSDGDAHRLSGVQARLGLATLSGDATLAARPPFALSGRAQLRAAAYGHDFALALGASGTLERLRVAGPASDDGRAAGQVRVDLAPLAVQPLVALGVELIGVDPALFVAGAPSARFDVDLALAPAADGALGGRLHLGNRASGRFDRQLLPLLTVDSVIDWRGSVLDFGGLRLALAGGGALHGHGRLVAGQLDLDLQAQRVDAQALHGALLPTRLAGPLHASLGVAAQRVDVDWRDQRVALSASLSASARAVELTRLQLVAGGASLDARGSLALAGERRFTAHGRLRDFAAARFFGSAASGWPRSVLNATLDASGALQPQLALALRFDLADSQLGDQRLAGHGDVDWAGGRLRRADVDLAAAGNRLSASGAWGRAGDTLHVELAAPRLAALGFPALGGEAQAAISAAGSLASPEFSGHLDATRLHLGPWLEIGGLSFKAQLGAGEHGVVAATLQCTACASPAYAIPASALELRVAGERLAHRLDARIGLPGARELRLALAGGVLSTPVFGWRGALAELRLAASGVDKTPPLLELAGPAPLQFGASALAFGPANLAGRLGRLSVDALALDAGRWHSSGRLLQLLPQQALAEFPSLRAWRESLGGVGAPPLELAGDWDLALGATPAGRVALWRERGDLALGSLPLGLSEARLQADIGDGRVSAKALLRGSRVGEISADLSALASTAPPSGVAPAKGEARKPGPVFDRWSPWQGRLQARVPDLSWLGPLLGAGWQLAGRVDGELALAGNAAHPELSGQWRGEQLALRALDYGVRLERGQAELALTPQRLVLRRLRFESDWQPLPRSLRLDERVAAARLQATPGVLEASGELPLAGAADGTARLGFRLDRVGIVQRADQWVAVSGDGELRFGERLLDVDGKLRADAAFWALAAAGRPSLSDDVLLHSAAAPREASRVARALKLDVEVDLGRSSYFRGAGVDSRLAGLLRVRSDDAGLPRATGSIRTVDGRFDAYGQKLDIERGIVNFQGPIDNPGLNVLAVRKNLPVEAGVEVSGTVQRPQIRLVSTPNVPDAEKLSWLVLGHSPEQQGGGDSTLLFAAAQSLFGAQDGGVLRQLQRGLGIDEFGVASGQIGGLGTLPGSRVASSSGFSGSNPTVNGQIVSVGKRLASNALLSYEQSLNTTESIVKLTLSLSRQFSVVASAGSDSALDFFWNFSFGK